MWARGVNRFPMDFKVTYSVLLIYCTDAVIPMWHLIHMPLIPEINNFGIPHWSEPHKPAERSKPTGGIWFVTQ